MNEGERLFDISGQTAIVTGGSRGLGQSMAIALAKAGARVFVTARQKESCDETLKMINDAGGTAEAYALDVRNRESITSFAEAVRTTGTTVQILVNNAGCNTRKPVLEVSWEDWDRIMETNLRGPFFVTQAILPMMLEQRYGRVINIGSVTSVFGYAGIAPYCASRGGILQMTKAMADEFGPKGVTVNCLAPGWFRTEQTRALYENPEWLAYLVDRIPVRRPGQLHDLDGAVVFLASRSSEYVTGQIMLVDGGISTGATRATVSGKKD